MKCSEFHEQAAAYALDALSEAERLACLGHLRDEAPHEGCEELVLRYELVVDSLSTAVSAQKVKSRVWRAIATRLGIADDDGAVTPQPRRTTLEPGSSSRWREGLAWSAAALALLGALASHQSSQELVRNTARARTRAEQALASTSAQLTNAAAARSECSAALLQLTQRGQLSRDAVSLLELPSTRLTPMAPTGTQPYRATALYNAETERAVIISSSITKVPGKDYELWVIAAGEAPKPAGFLHFDASGVALGEFDSALLRRGPPAAFAVSLEPAGGRPTPTEVVLLGKLAG